MLKETELRIGNIVNYKNENVIVDRISTIGINSEYGETLYMSEEIEPIPITEDILLKCGFIEVFGVKKEYKIKINKKEDILVYNLIVEETSIWTDYGGFYLDNQINYIHQLQNLYFALTGNELTIKL